jgi:SAM-dependent methyltransferase
MPLSIRAGRLSDTRQAFDSIAAAYDGPRHNNALLRRMRADLWRTLAREVPAGGRLLDLGCGPGLDAVHFARAGYDVTAIDWSPQMAAEARAHAAAAGVGDRVEVRALGIQELGALGGELFDGVYSDFGPFNCVPDLRAAASACADRLRPGGKLIVSVMGRVVPWEHVYYALRGDLARAFVRLRRGAVPVSMNRQTVWTAYYTPREFHREFAHRFELTAYRGLALCLPPPYLVDLYHRFPALGRLLGWLDDRLAGLPLLRAAGDHFLMVMTRRAGAR